MSDQYEVWKKIVDVQMHFNDLEMRIRNFGLTVLSGAFAGAGFAFLTDKGVSVGLAETVPLHAVVLLVATVVWLLFWFMERHWYHRLLMGSVKAGLEIEKNLQSGETGISLLAQKISDESPVPFFGRQLHSGGKIDLFYWTIATVNLALVIASIAPQHTLCFLAVALVTMFLVLYGFAKKKTGESAP